MKNHEKAVREAAAALHHAIQEARTAHLVVAWPHGPEGLAAIAISETSKGRVAAVQHPHPPPPPADWDSREPKRRRRKS